MRRAEKALRIQAILDELYPAPKWRKFINRPRTNHATKGRRIEVLWTNYDPPVPGNGANGLFE